MAEFDDADLTVKTPIWQNPGVLLLLMVVAGVAVWWLLLGQADPISLTKEANRELMRGHVDTAVEGYTKALAMDPTHAAAQVGLGAALFDKKDFAQAAAAFEKALTLATADKSQKEDSGERLGKTYLAMAKAKPPTDPAHGELLAKSVKHMPTGEGALLYHDLLMLQASGIADKDPKGAVALAVKARALQTNKAKRAEALDAQLTYGMAAWRPEFDKEFDAKLAEELAKTKHYDPKVKGFYVKVETEHAIGAGVSRKIHDVTIMNKANSEAKAALLKLFEQIAGKPAKALEKLPEALQKWEQQTWTEGWVREPTKYALGYVMKYDDMARVVFLIRHADQFAAPGAR